MPFKTVLDIGAGKGDDLMLVNQIGDRQNSCQRFALEAYDEYVKILTEKGIQVYAKNIERDIFPFEDGSIDVVIANQILEHTKELFWIFHEITRILPVGGKLIIGVPNLASLHNRLLLLLGKQPTPIQTNSAHIRGFTKGDILKFVEICFPGGYELKAFGGSNFYPFPPVIAHTLARIFPTMAWGIFLLLEKQRNYQREFLDYPVVQHLETNFYIEFNISKV
jgi:SAM-dependent methyltransferase